VKELCELHWDLTTFLCNMKHAPSEKNMSSQCFISVQHCTSSFKTFPLFCVLFLLHSLLVYDIFYITFSDFASMRHTVQKCCTWTIFVQLNMFHKSPETMRVPMRKMRWLRKLAIPVAYLETAVTHPLSCQTSPQAEFIFSCTKGHKKSVSFNYWLGGGIITPSCWYTRG
jgi:hypothetical protein